MTTLDRTSYWNQDRDFAVQVFTELGLDDRASALVGALLEDPTGEHHAQVGLAHFLREYYDLAAWYFDVAIINHKRENPEWRSMVGLADANHVAIIKEPVPPVYHFKLDCLLEPPTISDDELPEPPCPPQPPGLLTQLGILGGNFVGWGSSKV